MAFMFSYCIGSNTESPFLDVWLIAVIAVGGVIIIVALPVIIVCVIVLTIKCRSGT